MLPGFTLELSEGPKMSNQRGSVGDGEMQSHTDGAFSLFSKEEKEMSHPEEEKPCTGLWSVMTGQSLLPSKGWKGAIVK